MALYESLYVRNLCWAETCERKVIGYDFVNDATHKIIIIRDRLQAVQDRQKKYYDAKQRYMEFKVGDFIFIKIRLMKGALCFDNTDKLSPRCIAPFDIVERIGNVACILALQVMYDVYNVFHIASLRKFISDDPSKIIMKPVDIQLDLTYVEKLDYILEFSVKQL
ncbi:uncharacterized protein LOC110109930 [Dendrobium catenatum]|uniref:uncharacterized protein LOC110109930 n=1 Tax=Dendrobium catenatum TaxID=906689 RepID=UPI0009F59B15|nr:uncharacterized protein LOC110109930 [Dendrobium catenatum]